MLMIIINTNNVKIVMRMENNVIESIIKEFLSILINKINVCLPLKKRDNSFQYYIFSFFFIIYISFIVKNEKQQITTKQKEKLNF